MCRRPVADRHGNSSGVEIELFVATFRVARSSSQTLKLWLVGVATDRDAPLACPNVKNTKKEKKKSKETQAKKNICQETPEKRENKTPHPKKKSKKEKNEK